MNAMKKSTAEQFKQGAASRGLQLVGLLRGDASAEEVEALAASLIAASEHAKRENAAPKKPAARKAKVKPASSPAAGKKKVPAKESS